MNIIQKILVSLGIATGGVVFAATPPESLTISTPLSHVEIRESREDAAGVFELFADKVVYKGTGGQRVIPFGSRGVSVYGGLVDYVTTSPDERVFKYYGPKEDLTLLVQGRRFALVKGGSLIATRSAGGCWSYQTVGGMSDGARVTEMMVSLAENGANMMFRPGSQGDARLVSSPAMPQAQAPARVALSMPEKSPEASFGAAGSVTGGFDTPVVNIAELKRRLYAKPAEELVLKSMTLQEAFAFLARKAGISFIYADGGGGKGSGSESLMTSRAMENPFRLLELMAFEQGSILVPVGVTKEFPDGVWVLRSMEREGLIARTYRLKYGYQTAGVGGGIGSGGGGAARFGSGSGTGAGLGGRSLKPANVKVFDSDGSRIQQDIANLLELAERGLVVNGDTDYRRSDEDLNRELDRLGVPMVRQSQNPKIEGPKSRVLFSELTGTLFVAATRQQHEWVRGYLRAIDRPLKNVILEVKFVETSKSPSSNYGVKWPTEFNLGFGSRNNLVANMNTSGGITGGSIGGGVYTPGTNVPGYDQNGAAIAIPRGFPLVGLLRASDLNFVISALKEDSEGSNIRYYYCTVSENREVLVKNTEQVPVLAASAQVSTGSLSGGTTSQAVEYMDIGLIMNVKPRIVGDNDIALSISLELSTILRYDVVGGVSYPVPGVRVYEAPVTVSSGESLAIGGLDEYMKSVVKTRTMPFGYIPVLGKLFTHKSKKHPQRHMLVFVTATLQDDYSGGVDRARRGVHLGDWRGYFGGVANMADLRRVVEGLYPYVSQLEQDLQEGVLTKAHFGDLNALLADIRAINDDYDRLSADGAGDNSLKLQLQDWERRVKRIRAILE